jgi:phospholipid-translocating ATPase
MFPFTSESKNMGIMIKYNNSITYFLKGADTVMKSKIGQTAANFMSESCLDLAREGLRTLVVAQKTLSL